MLFAYMLDNRSDFFEQNRLGLGKIDEELEREMNNFLSQWLIKLIQQGHQIKNTD